ncbi:hypothetical protein NPS74_21215, partial [Cutibacterium acnes subsp. acnes]|nr:hypothetical protein [Cutibacterium acnes subsp. acnes]
LLSSNPFILSNSGWNTCSVGTHIALLTEVIKFPGLFIRDNETVTYLGLLYTICALIKYLRLFEVLNFVLFAYAY